jgi:hypothetical protein
MFYRQCSILKSSIFDPQSSILNLRSSILDPLSSILNLRSSIFDPLSSILYPRSSILYPLSSILYPRSSILDPLSSILYPRSSILEHHPLLRGDVIVTGPLMVERRITGVEPPNSMTVGRSQVRAACLH